MFLDLDGLTVEQLIQKQIEVRERMMQARSMSPMVTDQLRGMLDQISLQLEATVEKEKLNAEREQRISEGKDPDEQVLNIGDVE